MTALLDIYGHAHELPGPYKSLTEVRAANQDLGHHFFDPDSLRFFGSQIESVFMEGRLFITSEAQPSHHPDFPPGERRYTIRVACDNGAVHTVGEFQQHASLNAALGELGQIVRLVKGAPA